MARPEVTDRSPFATDLDRERWLSEIVTLAEGAALRRVSVDTLRREGKRGTLKIIELSRQRRGITRREALKAISTDDPEAA